MLVRLGTIPVSIPRGGSWARTGGIRAVKAELISTDPRNARMMSLGHLPDGDKEPPATESPELLRKMVGLRCRTWVPLQLGERRAPELVGFQPG